MAVPQNCTLDTCPIEHAYLHYQPSIPGNAFMLAAFAVLIPPVVYFGVKYRTRLFSSLLTIGLIGEVVGYVGRLLLHRNPFLRRNFAIYLVPITLAPAFMSASIYLTLAHIVVVYGENTSYLRPRTYSLLFSASDIVALVLQAAGGGIAAAARTKIKIDRGTHILIAGLAFQVASLVAFILTFTAYLWRVRKYRAKINRRWASLHESAKWKVFLCSLVVATVLILVRCAYRTAELSGGFSGHLAQDQITFMVLDGAMVWLACFILVVQNPGLIFKEVWAESSFLWFRKS